MPQGAVWIRENVMVRVGVLFGAKKQKYYRENWEAALAKTAGVQFILLDPDTDYGCHGPFDLILQKLSEGLTIGDSIAEQRLQRFTDYCAANPKTAILDRMEEVEKVLQRSTMYQLTKSLGIVICGTMTFSPTDFTVVSKGFRGDAPVPAIIKTCAAAGSHATHEMAVVFSRDKLGAAVDAISAGVAGGDVVVQRYYDHYATLIKVFVVGDDIHWVTRRSLPAASTVAGREEDVMCEVINCHDGVPRQWSAGDANSPEEVLPPEVLSRVNNESLVQYVTLLRQHLKLSLFGLDIIYNQESGMFMVVDINYFPSYGEVMLFPELLAQMCAEAAAQTRTKA